MEQVTKGESDDEKADAEAPRRLTLTVHGADADTLMPVPWRSTDAIALPAVRCLGSGMPTGGR